MLKDIKLNLESENKLKDTSMFHFSMKQKEIIQVLEFTYHQVTQIYNFLINFVPNMNVSKLGQPTALFSSEPFINCSFREC